MIVDGPVCGGNTRRGGVEPFKVARNIIDEYNNKNANVCAYCGCGSVFTVPSLYEFCDYDALHSVTK